MRLLSSGLASISPARSRRLITPYGPLPAGRTRRAPLRQHPGRAEDLDLVLGRNGRERRGVDLIQRRHGRDEALEARRTAHDQPASCSLPDPIGVWHTARVGDLDLGIVYRFSSSDDEDDGLEWIHLLDDPYAIALPADHRLAAQRQVALTQLAGERWVSPPLDHPYAQVLRRLCHEHGGFEPKVGYETGDIAMAQPLVAAGLAV